jgi:hypothetical protein
MLLEYGRRQNFVGIWKMKKINWRMENEKFFGKWTMNKLCWNMDNDKILLEYGK